MDNFTAMMIAEGEQEPESEQQYYEAWQHLHDSSLAYTLQGWFGRTARRMINEGLINE
jgi:hypothetical protein